MPNGASAATAAVGGASLTVATFPDVATWAAGNLGGSPEQLRALAIAGAVGAFVRAVYMPEPSWWKRTLQGVAGAASAIFLGGILGHVIDAATGAGPYAYLAAGFIMGEGGVAAIHAVRDRFTGGPRQ